MRRRDFVNPCPCLFSHPNCVGDEDNGEQGAWFVLVAMGIYPLVVGDPRYIATSPIFPHVRVTPSGRYTQDPDSLDDTAAVDQVIQLHNSIGFPSDFREEGGREPVVYRRAKGGAKADHSESGTKDGRVKKRDAGPAYLDIFAYGTSEKVIHVDKMSYNGKVIPGPYIDHGIFQSGGRLSYHMSGVADKNKEESQHGNGLVVGAPESRQSVDWVLKAKQQEVLIESLQHQLKARSEALSGAACDVMSCCLLHTYPTAPFA